MWFWQIDYSHVFPSLVTLAPFMRFCGPAPRISFSLKTNIFVHRLASPWCLGSAALAPEIRPRAGVVAIVRVASNGVPAERLISGTDTGKVKYPPSRLARNGCDRVRRKLCFNAVHSGEW
jgi:hypothetical protein